jgi:hypothetical protein
MSNTPVKVAFACFVILAYPAASLARHAITAATRNKPTAAVDQGSRGKCVLDRPTVAATPDRAAYSVCWAPEDITDGPGV